MKKCPYCAEDIQATAIVCRYCQRDLVVQPSYETPRTRWGRLLLILAAVIAIPVLIVQCSADHQRYLKFAEQRDAWHRKCDRYRTTTPSDPDRPIAAACARELDELTAYAKQQGWAAK